SPPVFLVRFSQLIAPRFQLPLQTEARLLRPIHLRLPLGRHLGQLLLQGRALFPSSPLFLVRFSLLLAPRFLLPPPPPPLLPLPRQARLLRPFHLRLPLGLHLGQLLLQGRAFLLQIPLGLFEPGIGLGQCLFRRPAGSLFLRHPLL